MKTHVPLLLALAGCSGASAAIPETQDPVQQPDAGPRTTQDGSEAEGGGEAQAPVPDAPTSLLDTGPGVDSSASPDAGACSIGSTSFGGASCEACVASACCAQAVACEADPDCLRVVACTQACVKGGGNANTCGLTCLGEYPDAGADVFELRSCEETSCPTKC